MRRVEAESAERAVKTMERARIMRKLREEDPLPHPRTHHRGANGVHVHGARRKRVASSTPSATPSVVTPDPSTLSESWFCQTWSVPRIATYCPCANASSSPSFMKTVHSTEHLDASLTSTTRRTACWPSALRVYGQAACSTQRNGSQLAGVHLHHRCVHPHLQSNYHPDDVHMRIDRVLRQIGQRDKIPGEK